MSVAGRQPRLQRDGESTPAEREAWIALASVTGLGPLSMTRLVAGLGSARAVLALARDGGIDDWSRRNTDASGRQPLTAPVRRGLEEVGRDPRPRLQRIAQAGLWTLTPLDAAYPERLRELDPPPPVIYGLGDEAVLAGQRLVAVVGTRRPTPAGRLLASRICARLSEAGAVVVSGLAVGIDGAAHAATVEHGGRTIGVVGGGHDHPGPRAHARLRDEMAAGGGAVVSEHWPETRPTRGTYPQRNRIIAALAEATVVIEAPARSGALITARHALELGRPVFVAPGRVGDWTVAGSLALLRETPARPLVGLDELIEDLGYLAPAAGGRAADQPVKLLELLGPSARAVAERLQRGAAGIDLIADDTGLPPAVVASALTLLLMRGWAHVAGPAYLPAGPLLR